MHPLRRLIVVAVILGAVMATFFRIRRGRIGTDALGIIRVTMVHSEDQTEWLNEAMRAFGRNHPEIEIRLVPNDHFVHEKDLPSAGDAPTVWSPSDVSAIKLLEVEWNQARPGKPLPFSWTGEDGPQPLVHSPLVWVAWKDSMALLASHQRHLGRSDRFNLSWEVIHDTAAHNASWADIAGPEYADWGLFTISHGDPLATPTGFQAIYMMSLAYHHNPVRLTEAKEVTDPALHEYLRDIEQHVGRVPMTPSQVMADLLREGPAGCDVAALSESFFLTRLADARNRWGDQLRVYYPVTTVFSDHPVVTINPDSMDTDSKDAARAWVRFLRGRRTQERALAYGFRPDDTSISLCTDLPDNLFRGLPGFCDENAPGKPGADFVRPDRISSPEGDIVRLLLNTWPQVGGAPLGQRQGEHQGARPAAPAP